MMYFYVQKTTYKFEFSISILKFLCSQLVKIYLNKGILMYHIFSFSNIYHTFVKILCRPVNWVRNNYRGLITIRILINYKLQLTGCE